MTEIQNLQAVLKGEKPERFPYCPMGHWNRLALKKLLPEDCYDENLYCTPESSFGNEPRSEESRRRTVNYAMHLGCSSLGTGKGGALPFGHGGPAEIMLSLESTEPNGSQIYKVEGGSTRRYLYDPYSVEYGHTMPLESPADLEKLELPNPRDPSRWIDIEADSKAFSEAGVMPSAKIMGFFSGMHNSFMDFEKLMLAFFDSPDFVHELNKILSDWSMSCVEEVVSRGVKLIEVCDDLATAEGLMISPQMFETFYLPSYRRLIEYCHSKGVVVHMHSHGDISAVMPMLIDAGVDILNPFDPQEHDSLEELIDRFSADVVFCGFIPSNYYMIESEQELETMIARAVELGRRCQKGYVIMEHGFPHNLSVERYNLVIDLITKYRQQVG